MYGIRKQCFRTCAHLHIKRHETNVAYPGYVSNKLKHAGRAAVSVCVGAHSSSD